MVRRLTPVLRIAVREQMIGEPRIEVDKRIETLSLVIARTTAVVIGVAALLTSLPEIGLNVAPLVAGVGIEPGDLLINVKLTSGHDQVVLITSEGMSIRFSEEDVRSMGRPAAGVGWAARVLIVRPLARLEDEADAALEPVSALNDAIRVEYAQDGAVQIVLVPYGEVVVGWHGQDVGAAVD